MKIRKEIRTSLKELAELIIKLKNANVKIKFKKNNKFTLVKNRIGSTKKANKEINFLSQVNLKQGLKDLITWRDLNKSSN